MATTSDNKENWKEGNHYYIVNIDANKLSFVKKEYPKGYVTKDDIKRIYGWKDFTFRFFNVKADISLDDHFFYLEESINDIVNSSQFEHYREVINNVDVMLEWYRTTDMTINEFLEAYILDVPQISFDDLESEVLEYFKETDSSYWEYEPINDEEEFKNKCLSYLRHNYTPYEKILKVVRETLNLKEKPIREDTILSVIPYLKHDTFEQIHYYVKNEINNIIKKFYPSLRKAQ